MDSAKHSEDLFNDLGRAESLPLPERPDRQILEYPDPSLVLVTGPSGVGKTTFIQRTAPDHGISSDHIRQLLWADEMDRRGREIVFETLTGILSARFEHKRESAVVDIVGLKPEARDTFTAIAKAYDIPSHLILLEGEEGELRATGQLKRRGLPEEWLDDMLVEQQETLRRIESGEIGKEGFSTAISIPRPEARTIEHIRFSKDPSADYPLE